jgi:hypothetical protein
MNGVGKCKGLLFLAAKTTDGNCAFFGLALAHG